MKYILLIFQFFISVSVFGQDNELFDFKSDLRFFVAYSFINASGFDFDHTEYHPIRSEVRAYVDSILPPDFKLKIGKYYSDTKLNWTDCVVYASQLSTDLQFKWMCDSCKTDLKAKYQGLDTLYREFYELAEIGQLWTKYQPKLDSINLMFKPYSDLAINQITEFCKIGSDYYTNHAKKLHYMKIPLISNFTAFTFTTDNHMYIIDGPPIESAGPDNYYHEALHPAIGQIINQHAVQIYSFSQLNDSARNQLKENYNDTKELFEESMVRVIDMILRGKHFKKSPDEVLNLVKKEYERGFIFSLYIYEIMLKYEVSEQTLEDFFSEAISKIDISYEEQRYKEFWDKKD